MAWHGVSRMPSWRTCGRPVNGWQHAVCGEDGQTKTWPSGGGVASPAASVASHWPGRPRHWREAARDVQHISADQGGTQKLPSTRSQLGGDSLPGALQAASSSELDETRGTWLALRSGRPLGSLSAAQTRFARCKSQSQSQSQSQSHCGRRPPAAAFYIFHSTPRSLASAHLLPKAKKMSGPGENRYVPPPRWRRQGQANRNSGASTPTKDAGRQQPMAPPTANVWGAKQAKASGPPQTTATTTATPAQSQPEHHVPVKDFNANEVRDFLKKKYLESTANQPAVYHKVPGDSVSNRSSGAWGKGGTMPHLMPTGQDFFTQLKKQLASLDQTKAA
ncbi:hypothetical protein ACJQWK_10972 [Exserohilum turcicum]